MSGEGAGRPRRGRKIAVTVFILVVVGVGLFGKWCDAPAFATGSYLQAVTSRTAVIVRVSAEPVSLAAELQVDGESVRQTDLAAPKRRHEIFVDALEPDTRYEYLLRDDQSVVVDSGSFVTHSEVDGKPVRFAVIGDSGGQPWWVYMQRSPAFAWTGAREWLPAASKPRAIGAQLAAAKPDFWLHVGDVIYPKGAQEHYSTGFFQPFAEVLRHAPCYPVLGNHDVMTEGGAPFLANFVLPGSDGKGSDDERRFTFTDGPLRVIGLDLNPPVDAKHPSIVYLRSVLETATEPWILVANHFPVRSTYREHPRKDLEEHYVPLCAEFGVDLLLAGHDHNYQRFASVPPQIVTGGGGKSLYDTKFDPEGLVVVKRAYHISEVEITGATLRLRATSIEGELLDDFTIDKRVALDAGTLRDRPARIERLRAMVGR